MVLFSLFFEELSCDVISAISGDLIIISASTLSQVNFSPVALCSSDVLLSVTLFNMINRNKVNFILPSFYAQACVL